MHFLWGMGHFGWFGMGFVWILLIGLILWAVIRGRGGCCHTINHSRNDALKIAEERYARGEISREEFEQIRKDLV